MSDPISIFRAAAAAVESEAWHEVAALCDPATLSLYKREILSRLEASAYPWTAERLLQLQPDLPVDVAEFQAARLAEAADPHGVLDELPGISSVEQLRATPPAEVFAAWLEGQSFSRQLERARGIPDIPARVLEEAMQFRVRTRYDVLGAVPDGDRITFVVFRREHESAESSVATERPEDRPAGLTDAEVSALQDQHRAYVEFAPLRRQSDGSWRLIAGSGFLGLNHTAFSFGFDGEAADYDGGSADRVDD